MIWTKEKVVSLDQIDTMTAERKVVSLVDLHSVNPSWT